MKWSKRLVSGKSSRELASLQEIAKTTITITGIELAALDDPISIALRKKYNLGPDITPKQVKEYVLYPFILISINKLIAKLDNSNLSTVE